MLQRVKVKKLSGGLNRVELLNDGISGLITNGVAITAGVQTNTVYRLESLDDAVSLLITEKYDTDNTVLVYEHIKEYFRVTPNGSLYIMVAPLAIPEVDMVDPTKEFGTKLLREAEGKIQQLGVAFNPSAGNVADLLNTIAKAQELADYQSTKDAPVHITLDGNGYDYTTPIDIKAQNANSVSVVIGQSINVASRFPNYTAVGTVLGAISKAKVNESIAWVRNFNLQGGSLTGIAINGQPVSNYTDGYIERLHEKGGLFFITENGISGYYLNNSNTGISATDDYAYIENIRTINKASRLIRTALLPWVNQSIPVDKESGKIAPSIVSAVQTDGKRALEQMLSNEEVSAIDILVDPNQDIIGTGRLSVDFSIVPTGTAKEISATVGFENPFKN